MICSVEPYMTPYIAMQLAKLMDSIKGGRERVTTYLEYLRDFYDTGTIAVLTISNEKEILGFMHIEAPHPVFPERGFILMAAVSPIVSRKHSKELLDLAEDWFTDKGVTVWEMQTERNPAVFSRACGAKMVNFHTMERQINGRRRR